MKHWIIACVVVFGVPACSSDGDVNLGEDNPVALGEKLTDYSGTWQGYAEAYEFYSGSDRVVLSIAEDGTGYAVFGEGTAPPPATNPEVGYPAGSGLDVFPIFIEFLEGVQYPLRDVIVEDRRLRLQLSANDLWEGWCGLQTPVLVQEGGSARLEYRVLPTSGFGRTPEGECFVPDGTGTGQVRVDCGKAALNFQQVCACTANACRPNADAGTGPVGLDAALESLGDELVGTLTIAGRVTVRLSRQ
jgi:hypothetical protein